MEKQKVRVRGSVTLVALAALLLIGGTLDWAISASGRAAQQGVTKEPITLRLAPANASPAPPVSLTEGFSAIVQPLLPAVVNISSSKMVKATRGQSPFGDDPFFRQFFGNPFGDQGDNGGQQQQQAQPRSQREHSLGSGVIVSPDGYIITNNHVVDGATDIEVALNDKRQFKAKVVGTDPRTDVAVLKIPATGLATVVIGDSARMRVGDIVLAIGDPFGIGETVTMGIVSATSRRGLNIEGEGGYEDFIQTDAAINPGNSGGALVNTRGELIGINTAIISGGEGGGNQGVGFAVPVNMARSVMEQLLTSGKVTRGYLGVMIQEVTPTLAKAFNLPSAAGALVGDVTPDSPGAKAGLKKGDVITGINGTSVSEYSDLRLRISQTAPGEHVKLEVFRDGKKMEISATLAEFPDAKTTAEDKPAAGENALAGVQVDALTPNIAQQLNVPASLKGVVVTSVDPDSPAADSQLMRGDVITEVNHNPVASIQQFRDEVRSAGNKPLLLLVNHRGTTGYVVISPRE